MTAFNVVRMRVKPGREQDFINAGNLDRSRDLLEDLGGDLGVTDPVSGEVVGHVT